MSCKTSKDILEQKIHELEKEIEGLRKSKDDFSSTKEVLLKVFLISPVATVVTSISDGKIIQVNDAFTNLTGYGHHEITGQATVDVDMWVNKQERRTMLRLLHDKKSLENFHAQIKTTSGDIRECLFSAQIFSLHNEQFVISMAIEVTRRIKAERELRESEGKQRIYLPWHEVPPGKKGPAGVARGKATVLLVDDEAVLIEVGKEIIEHLGYEVFTALNGKDALRIYRENMDQIGLVILDMVMPDLSGGKTYDKLKEIDTDVKVLLSSGYCITDEAQKILDRGCSGFIQKPFSISDLANKINAILSASKASKKNDCAV